VFGLSCTFGFDVSRNQFQESQESLNHWPFALQCLGILCLQNWTKLELVSNSVSVHCEPKAQMKLRWIYDDSRPHFRTNLDLILDLPCCHR